VNVNPVVKAIVDVPALNVSPVVVVKVNEAVIEIVLDPNESDLVFELLDDNVDAVTA
jgi:hypothetical protein